VFKNKTLIPLVDSSGVFRPDTQGLSPPEARPYDVSGTNRPRERSPRSGAPGWAADKRGHYRDQHQPEDSDPDLLLDEGHNNSTQIVVKLFREVFADEKKTRN